MKMERQRKEGGERKVVVSGIGSDGVRRGLSDRMGVKGLWRRMRGER